MKSVELKKKKRHLRRRKRERPALVDADVWVYRGTVYNTKGTTWSGSPLWKEEQQEVWQHWFIDSYIAAYLQVLYRVIGVHPTSLIVDQGCRQVSTTSSFHFWQISLISIPREVEFFFNLTRGFKLLGRSGCYGDLTVCRQVRRALILWFSSIFLPLLFIRTGQQN